MTDSGYNPADETAREYYNSEDADNFYYLVWGGEDLHVGLYERADEPVYDASRRTVARMCELVPSLGRDSEVLDLGGGYGGSGRYLAHTYGCPVKVLNISERENERGRDKNREQGVDHLVEIIDGSFDDVPYDDNSFDILWSQDAMLHSGNRQKVLEEANRVIKPGGYFVFTDPMQADDCPEGVIDPILQRIHLDTLGTPGFYRDALKKLGFEEITFEDHSDMIAQHYGRVREILIEREEDVAHAISRDYMERMKTGLGHWVEGGRNGHLAWGIFVFRKSS
jgi:sarcosine/dimethylglycine N-methyltransferase